MDALLKKGERCAELTKKRGTLARTPEELELVTNRFLHRAQVHRDVRRVGD
jgi:hypothetical protein